LWPGRANEPGRQKEEEGRFDMSKPDHLLDVDFIEALASMLRAHDLTEIAVRREYGEDDSLDVRVARMGAALPLLDI